mgnify:CR=1 FL=1
MIRDRLKKAAKKIALKAFGMEFEAEARTTVKTMGTKGVYDASKIPKLVEGPLFIELDCFSQLDS